MSRTGHHRYRKKREKLLKSTRHHTCHLCGESIDISLEYPDPGSWSADHVEPVSLGGSNDGELKAAHLFCNQSRGNRDNMKQRQTEEQEEVHVVRHVLEWR